MSLIGQRDRIRRNILFEASVNHSKVFEHCSLSLCLPGIQYYYSLILEYKVVALWEMKLNSKKILLCGLCYAPSWNLYIFIYYYIFLIIFAYGYIMSFLRSDHKHTFTTFKRFILTFSFSFVNILLINYLKLKRKEK